MRIATLALLGAALIGAAPAQAWTFAISGTRANVNPITPTGVGRCGPGLRTVTIAPGALSSTGTSNAGAFTSTQSHCIVPPPPLPQDITDGEFTWSFEDGSTIFGTYTGQIFATATPGVIGNTVVSLVTGGTGLFLNATGTIEATGTLTFGFIEGIGQVGNATETFSGRLDIPAIPEPSNWAMMIAGFGLAGGVARRTRAARPVYART